MTAFDLPGLVRRVRRLADVSQRELAEHLGASKSAVAAIECGSRGMDARLLARAAALAGLRLAIVDAEGREVAGMSGDAVTDMRGRRFPAHLDTRYGDVDWWHDDGRYSRERPWYTFDRVRETRDHWRARIGAPGDHQQPRPDDSPAARKARRARERREAADEEFRRRLAAGELADEEQFLCVCPAVCDEVDDWSGKPVHAPGCRCGCDLG